MKMKDNESVKDYSGRLMNVVNQIRLLGKVFTDHKVVEKIMVSVPRKFEAKISAIEESCVVNNLIIAELTNKLHVHEQRVQMRDEEAIKGAFQANTKERSSENLQRKKSFKFTKGKTEMFQESKITHLALIAKEPTMLRRIVGIKTNLLSSAHSAIISTIVRNIAEHRRNNLNNIFSNKKMFQKKKKRMKSTCLWHHQLLVLMNKIVGSLTVAALVT